MDKQGQAQYLPGSDHHQYFRMGGKIVIQLIHLLPA